MDTWVPYSPEMESHPDPGDFYGERDMVNELLDKHVFGRLVADVELAKLWKGRRYRTTPARAASSRAPTSRTSGFRAASRRRASSNPVSENTTRTRAWRAKP